MVSVFQLCMNLRESITFSASVHMNMLVIIVVTAMINALYICSLLISPNCNMQVRLLMTFSSDRIVKKIIIGNILRKKHACNNTYFNTFQARVTMIVMMTSPLSSMIKLTLKILTNVNTTGDIPLKQWHLKVLIQRMTDSRSFIYLIYPILFIIMTSCITTNQFR